MTTVPGKFPCTRCNACCRVVGALNKRLPKAEMLPEKSNGECLYLTSTGCGVYYDRPKICRIRDQYDPIKWSNLTEFYKDTARACNTLIDHLDIDASFKIDVDRIRA